MPDQDPDRTVTPRAALQRPASPLRVGLVVAGLFFAAFLGIRALYARAVAPLAQRLSPSLEEWDTLSAEMARASVPYQVALGVIVLGLLLGALAARVAGRTQVAFGLLLGAGYSLVIWAECSLAPLSIIVYLP